MFEVVLGSGPWIEAWRNQSARTLELLDLPSCEALSVAFREASTDSYQAIQSVYVFLYLALRPMLLLFHYAAKTIFLFLYKHIVVQGLYRNGLSQAREWSVRLFYFQRSLTRKQVLGEASFMVLFVGLYKLRRHVQDKQYYQRILVWYDRRKLQIVKSYESGVDRIATVSLVLAAMTPHMVFLTCCAGIKLLFPSLITVVACNSPLSGLLSRWIPWIATVTVIHDRFTNPLEKDSVGYTGEGKENSRKTEAISPPSSSKTAQDKQRPRHPLTPKTSGFFPRTPPSNKKRPRSRRSSVGSPLQRILRRNSEPLEEEEIYWIQYWSVHATLQLGKAIASFVPVLVSLGRYTWITAGLQQLELAFYVWIYILPWIIPETVGGMSLAEARPLPLLAKLVGPFFSTTHEQISSVVTTDFWQAQIVSRLEGILKVFVFLQLLSKDSAGSLVLCLQEGRSLLVPGLTLFMPGFITSFGVAYVQFVLPLSRTARGSTIPTTSQLQYWVLHVLLSSLFCNLASILWWIPFSSHAIFVAWAYISIPQKTVSCYESVREELQSFGILEGGDKPSIEQTRTAKVVRWVIHSLPAAAEVDGGGISSIDNTAQSESGSADISLLDRPHEDPPTPESPFSARGVSRDDEGYVEGDDCTLETARQFRRRNTTRLCRARDTTKNSKAA